TPVPKQPQQTQATDPNPCPPSTLVQRTSGPLRRPASGGVPKREDLQRELEKIRVDLDQYWQQQFAAHNKRMLYGSASRLELCSERNCAYRPRTGVILYNPELVLDLWRRYGRAGVVDIMAHEFGHKAEFHAKGQVSEAPQRELLADQLAGAYIA